MKKIFTILSVCTLAFLVACNEGDDPTPAHEVGDWALSEFALTNLPSGFQRNEGLTAGVNEITFGGVTLESYTFSLKNNGSYSREIDFASILPLNDKGEYEVDEDEFTFDSEDSDIGEQTFSLEKNEDDDLYFSVESTFGFIPDVYFDTVTQVYIDYLDTLTEQQLDSVSNELTQAVLLDLVYVFERD